MKVFIEELFKGKGAARAFLYEELHLLKDSVVFPAIDIACGKDPGYWRIFGFARDRHGSLVTLDRDAAAHPDIIHDLGVGPIPLPDESFKTAFLINCLYALPDPLYAMREASRLLVRGGRLIATFPFVAPYAPEPYDFHRFAEDRVRQLCADASFSVIRFVPFGGRWSSAAHLIGPFFRPYALFGIPLAIAARFLDAISDFIFPRFAKAPMGYLVVARRL